MDRLLRDRNVSFLVLVAASAIMPAAVLHFVPGDVEAPISYQGHFVVVSLAALVAAGAAFALTIVGARRDDGRTVLVGTAFSVMTTLLLLHGIGTEEVLVPEEAGLGPVAAAAVLPVGGAVLALSALPSLRRPRAISRLVALQIVFVAAVAALGAWGLAAPESLPPVPKTGSGPAVAVMVVGLAFFALVTVRAVRTYSLTRRRADLAVVVGAVWLAMALVPMLMIAAWSWAWWAGHVIEVIGVMLIGVPVALDLRRAAQSRPLVGDLRGAELVAQEEAFLGPRVRALMVRLAHKDAYTELHTRHVALRAVQVGEQLGLSAGRLRELAIGGLLHDIGKLSVPDDILQKPGPLADDEYEVIRNHPQWGAELIDELGGFPPQVRKLVLAHHERHDGSGYPQALKGEEIDFETSILAVCDVYDALVSKRVYRDAWSSGQALSLLEAESGRAFDARCVEALTQVLDAETRMPQPDAAKQPAPVDSALHAPA
jgi:putative nucleotidyltransferase with HDIG domain